MPETNIILYVNYNSIIFKPEASFDPKLFSLLLQALPSPWESVTAMFLWSVLPFDYSLPVCFLRADIQVQPSLICPVCPPDFSDKHIKPEDEPFHHHI